MQDFTRILERLADSGVEFVIIGGFAALTHGSAYMTRDIDICTVLSEENVERLRQAFRDWNPRHRSTAQRLSFLEHPKAGASVKNLYLETDYGIIDVLTSVLGVGEYDRLKQNAETYEVDGREYAVISIPDLIKAKETLRRDRDIMVAKELRAIAAKKGIALE